jgi:hypothetical protein
VVSASLGQLSAMRGDKPEDAGYGAEAFAYAGSNEIFDGGSSEPLVRFSQSGRAASRSLLDRATGERKVSWGLRPLWTVLNFLIADGPHPGIPLSSRSASQQKGRNHEEAMACCRRWPRAFDKCRGTALSPGPAAPAPAPSV